MYNTAPYYAVLYFHLISLVVGFGSVLVIDTFGLLWLLKWWGVDLKLVRRVAAVTQRLIWLGFTGLVLTGIPLLIMKGEVADLTIIKLALVAMVGLNGVFLHYIKKSMDLLGDDATEVPSKIHFRISLASAISQLGWWGAATIGFTRRQFLYDPAWASNYPLYIGLLLLAIGTAALIGERLARRNS